MYSAGDDSYVKDNRVQQKLAIRIPGLNILIGYLFLQRA